MTPATGQRFLIRIVGLCSLQFVNHVLTFDGDLREAVDAWASGARAGFRSKGQQFRLPADDLVDLLKDTTAWLLQPIRRSARGLSKRSPGSIGEVYLSLGWRCGPLWKISVEWNIAFERSTRVCSFFRFSSPIFLHDQSVSCRALRT